MIVRIDRVKQRVLVKGERFEIELTWSQAALLGVLLNDGARQLEPVLNFGKRYEPAIER
jgi:hypothetical protein